MTFGHFAWYSSCSPECRVATVSSQIPVRYTFRTLLILLAVGPMVLVGCSVGDTDMTF
jgi:hypothetical protein